VLSIIHILGTEPRGSPDATMLFYGHGEELAYEQLDKADSYPQRHESRSEEEKR
jgi:hypothetical protein